MTGLQLASFWEGNRAQLFATHVLSSVAAVVRVPVPMDFGHDLLCTLTRREHHALHAGRGFGVQVKSTSDSEIRYGGLNRRGEWKRYEIDWLYDQHQAFVVCVVDLKGWSVNLYSTQFMWWVPWQKGTPGEVVLIPDLGVADFSEAEGRSNENRYRFEALPRAADGSTAGDGFSYRVPLDYRNLTHRRLRVPYVEECLQWAANEPPQLPGQLWHFFNPTPDQNIREILSSLSPAIAALMHNLNHPKQYTKLEAVKPLARMIHEYGLLDGTAVGFVTSEQG